MSRSPFVTRGTIRVVAAHGRSQGAECSAPRPRRRATSRRGTRGVGPDATRARPFLRRRAAAKLRTERPRRRAHRGDERGSVRGDDHGKHPRRRGRGDEASATPRRRRRGLPRTPQAAPRGAPSTATAPPRPRRRARRPATRARYAASRTTARRLRAAARATRTRGRAELLLVSPGFAVPWIRR